MTSCNFGSSVREKGHGRTPVRFPKLYETVSARAFVIQLWQYICNQIKKNQIFIMMETSGSPRDCEALTLDFEGRFLTLNEPAIGQINICFDDTSQKLRFEVKNYHLLKINFMSVQAALKGTHPQIISAKFQTTEAGQECLLVKVSYEYLPQVVERIVFDKKEISTEESQKTNMREMRTFIRGMRDQLNSLGGVQIIQGTLDQTTDTQIFVKLNHRRTVFTWGLNLKNMTTNIIKVQFFYYSSTKKQRKSTSAIPEEGLYIHNSGNTFTEIKFLAELQDFDFVIFVFSGKAKGDYTISSEKVQLL